MGKYQDIKKRMKRIKEILPDPEAQQKLINRLLGYVYPGGFCLAKLTEQEMAEIWSDDNGHV